MRLWRRRKADDLPEPAPRLSVASVRGMLTRRLTRRLLAHPAAPAAVMLLVLVTFLAIAAGGVLSVAMGGPHG